MMMDGVVMMMEWCCNDDGVAEMMNGVAMTMDGFAVMMDGVTVMMVLQ